MEETTDLGVLRQKTLILLQRLQVNQGKVKKSLDQTLNNSAHEDDDIPIVREGPKSRRSPERTKHRDSRKKSPKSSKTSSHYLQSHHVIHKTEHRCRDAREKLWKGRKGEGQRPKESRSPKAVAAVVTPVKNDKVVYRKAKPDTADSANVSFNDSAVIADHYPGTPPNNSDVMSAISERTRTSTPKEVTSKADTPKSILKHRRLIDNHIKVDSKYSHPDIIGPTPKKIQLNFSYSDDPLKTPANRVSPNTSGGKSPYTRNLDGSYIEEYLDDENKPTDTLTNSKTQNPGRTTEVLLNDIGNDRKHAEIAREISRRNKSNIFESANQVLENQDDRSKLVTRSPKMKTLLNDRGPPLLGYDWIAGLLENDPGAINQSEAYFEDLKDFRQKYKDECVGKQRPSEMIESVAVVDDVTEIRDPAHSCIHGYTINDRLFTYPVNVDEEGRSICPICVTSRPEPTKEDPGFVRVSIPRSSLQTPYKVKPHRRRSFDDTDSCALAKHCVAGWECSKPAMLPSAKGLDLNREKQKIYKQLGTTLTEAQVYADSNSRQAKLCNDAYLSKTRNAERSKDNLDLLTRQARITDDLLDLSYSLRYNLQNLENQRGESKNMAANSTAYPLL